MEHDLFYFYKNAIASGLCEEYKLKWKQCKGNKRELMDLALAQQAIPYVVTAIYEGYGLSIGYLKQDFADYINGNYVAIGADGVEGYTSSMWVEYHGDKIASEDVNAYIGCDGYLSIEECKCPTIYVSNLSDIDVMLEGYNTVRFYVFDKSRIEFRFIPETSSVTVFCYDPRAKVEVGENLGEIKIFQKDLRL